METETLGLIGFVVLCIYGVLILFTFMSDNPESTALTVPNYLIRFFGVPAVLAAIVLIIDLLIHGIGTGLQALLS